MSDDGQSEAGSRNGGARGQRERERGKPARLARSRAACSACHKAKQRCDGPPGPCHRCTTWNTECVFPSAAGPTPSRTTLSRGATPQAPTRTTRGSTPVTNSTAAPSQGDVAEQLRLMNARLESMESALARAQFSASTSQLPPPPAAPPPFVAHRSQTGSDISPMPLAGITPLPEVHHEGANAVEAAGEAMAIEGLVDLSATTRNVASPYDSIRPDALGRSLLTVEECEAEFDFYFEHLQPWTCLLSTTLDRQPLVVRERSPLLFHAILLITIYYRPRTAANLLLYRSISSLLDALLAPQILCPQPDTLSSDFVRAIHLLLLYKPVQYAALSARGVRDLESASKMNVRASWLLRLLVSRVAAFIGLPSVATAFAQAFANQNNAAIPEEVVAQQRLYLGCVFHESHGALQSGKSANFIPQEACKTTRLFAAVKRQSSDVRLAASVELVATLSTLLNARKENGLLEEEDLQKYDEEMEAWSEYWTPLLSEPDVRDPLAWSVFYPYASFSRLTVRGFAFNRWKEDRRARAAAGYEAGVVLTQEERESVVRAAKVAEEMMLAVSTRGKGWRLGGKMSDEEAWGDDHEPLRPDPDVVESLKWASDSLTCVMFSYPLIFLAKLANEGLLDSDLTVIQPESPTLAASPMLPTDKLCRLFLLGADLLEAISPSPSHPAVKQASFLRKVREAAVSGRRSVTSAPSSPRLVSSSAAMANGSTPQRFPASFPSPAAARQAGPSSASLVPQPPTFPPPSAHGSSTAEPSRSSYEFSLSTSYQPTPLGSPRAAASSSTPLPPGSSTHVRPLESSTPVVEDPFSALLSGVSPNGAGAFDGADPFLALDSGFDWNLASTTSGNGEGSLFGGFSNPGFSSFF
ncbi:hypothetical protein JCM10212_004062 [Sporobolomyces blumeae]